MTLILGAVLAFDLVGGLEQLRSVTLYGVCGLLGFLCQLILGAGPFLFAPHSDAPTKLGGAPQQRLQKIVLITWTLGIPVLAAGLYLERATMIATAAVILLIAVACAAAQGRLIVRRA